MPKLTREKTLGKDRLNEYKKGNIKDLKNKVCTMTSDLIKTGGRVNIIFNYLVMVQGNMDTNGDKIPSNDGILSSFGEATILTPLDESLSTNSG